LLILGALLLALIVADFQTDSLRGFKKATAWIAAPFYWLSQQPSQIYNDVSSYFVSRDRLLVENERLQSEARILQGKVQKLVSLTAENVRLRELLSSSTVLRDSVLVAETISVSPNPLQHQIVINKNELHGVFVGQAVIDAYGLIGQVTEVNGLHAKVILISDVRHAIPVQINRNGVRAVAEGTGRIDTLSLPNLVETTDIKAGDLLVSSGLGQRFPVGYPVGVVESVESDPGLPFLKVVVRPSAKLDRVGHVLLVFAGEQPQTRATIAN